MSHPIPTNLLRSTWDGADRSALPANCRPEWRSIEPGFLTRYEIATPFPTQMDLRVIDAVEALGDKATESAISSRVGHEIDSFFETDRMVRSILSRLRNFGVLGSGATTSGTAEWSRRWGTSKLWREGVRY